MVITDRVFLPKKLKVTISTGFASQLPEIYNRESLVVDLPCELSSELAGLTKTPQKSL